MLILMSASDLIATSEPANRERVGPSPDPLPERMWNPLPGTGGRGLHDGFRGRTPTRGDRRWRAAMDRKLQEQGRTPEQARAIRKEFEEQALTLTSALAALYRTASLGNVADPVEEIVFMILSRRAPLMLARSILDELKQTAGGVPGLLALSADDLAERLRPLGIQLDGLDEKVVQRRVQDALPPSLRGSLRVNAIHHGQAVCRAPVPLCESCPVRLLCATGRQGLREQYRAEERLTLVDMFCGAGGLSEGFRRAGYRTVLAVDADEHAMRTYRLNHPEVDGDAMLCQDIRGFRDEAEQIRKIIGDTPIDVLVGGPPCQGFSRAGLRAKTAHGAAPASSDERNHLFHELVDLLEVLRPRAMVMENVPGMGEVRYEDGGTFVEAARAAMEAAGYRTTTWLLNAAAYGVAQDRVRRIIVGIRDGEAPQTPPPPTHHAPTIQHAVDSLLPGIERRAITLGEHLADLPPLEADQGENITAPGGRLLTGHVARFNNADDLERFREIRPGESYRRLIVRLPHLKCYGDESFPDKYYRMPADRPARTIVAHLQRDGNGFIHPHQVRSITPREAARLQSFDDSYLFTGPVTKVFRQVGNAVPPLLAEAIARHLREHLEGQSRDPRG